jgi:hypothetical protein
MQIRFILLIASLFAGNLVLARILSVGPGQTYPNPGAAARDALPGDTVLIFPGSYRGTFFIEDLHGRPDAWITFMGTDPDACLFDGGTEGMHFSRVSWLSIESLSFTRQTGNGLNIDDGGLLDTPSHHIRVQNCRFRTMGAAGNNDFLKISGLDTFEITQCLFVDGAAGGSGIDMVGCHMGLINQNTFMRMGSNSIQAKGGTQHIRIEANFFEDGGQRTLNLGGSTGLAFFRPQNAPFEAADIQVYSNFIKGSWAAVAYVGCVRVDVANNTIYQPQNWVIRILQETVDTTRFLPCGDNIFRNNIVVTGSSLSRHLNIGPNTEPATFTFSHNLWYNEANPGASQPQLPVQETAGLVGMNPWLQDPDENQFDLLSGSPAIHSGQEINSLAFDYYGLAYHDPPSRGAVEYEMEVGVGASIKAPLFTVFPNPSSHGFSIEGEEEAAWMLFSAQGMFIAQGRKMNRECETWTPGTLPVGVYFIHIQSRSGSDVIRWVRQL